MCDDMVVSDGVVITLSGGDHLSSLVQLTLWSLWWHPALRLIHSLVTSGHTSQWYIHSPVDLWRQINNNNVNWGLGPTLRYQSVSFQFCICKSLRQIDCKSSSLSRGCCADKNAWGLNRCTGWIVSPLHWQKWCLPPQQCLSIPSVILCKYLTE